MKRIAVTGFVAFIAFMLAGCVLPTSYQKQGKIAITIQKGEKTPRAIPAEATGVVFRAYTASSTVSVYSEFSGDTATVELSLPPGTYSIEAFSVLKSGMTTTVLTYGAKTGIVVESGKQTSATMTLQVPSVLYKYKNSAGEEVTSLVGSSTFSYKLVADFVKIPLIYLRFYKSTEKIFESMTYKPSSTEWVSSTAPNVSESVNATVKPYLFFDTPTYPFSMTYYPTETTLQISPPAGGIVLTIN